MPQWKLRKALAGKGVNVKKIASIIIIAVVLIALLKNGLNYLNARAHRDALITEVAELKLKNAETESKMKDIYNDREFVEKKAREELGMVKDGETVIKIKK